MQLKENDLVFAKVREGAIIPSKEDGNAGYDIYACFDGHALIIYPLTTALVPTGIASAMHDSKYLQAEERGSTGSKGIKKSAGVVDSNYRGEIFIAITNCNDKRIIIAKEGYVLDSYSGDDSVILYPYTKAIAQLVVHEVTKMDIKEVAYEELLTIESNRGVGMLGSSKK